MARMLPFVDGNVAFGVPEVVPRVLDDPRAGKLVRLRLRPGEFITAYFRKDRTFSRWAMRWTDDSQTCLMTLHPMAVNVRPVSPV